ncbi:MAG: ferrochelatase [Acidobacteria bacterium]|nr:ferrochelatase [Acidobacteriota bacterium]
MTQESAGPISGVLLLAHGAPDSLEDLEPFLLNIRGGRPVSPQLFQEIKERYRLIGGRSPLLDISRRQARALEQELNSTGNHARVYLGMRNWHPFIQETMEEIARDGVSRLLAVCLAPQNSRLSVGLYFQKVREAEEKLGLAMPISFAESWHNEPLLIQAFAEKLEAAMAEFSQENGGELEVLFTAHSLPRRILEEGDPYDEEVRETARSVAELCRLSKWRFAYQSQGATAEPWLGPTVESTLTELAQSGCKHLLLVPIGFVSDHVEILYDIDIAFRQFAAQRGIQLRRTESLNDSPTLIRALASVVQRQLAEEKKVGSLEARR